MKKLYLLLLCSLFFLPPFGGIEGGLAQSGSLDNTFDTDGKVTTPVGSSQDRGYSVAIQSDGKILVAGYSNNGTDNDFALVRYNGLSTGLQTLLNNQSVSIFPNPFSLNTTLHTDNLLKNATLTLYNSFGQTVKEIKNISGQTITFNRGNLASGLYFLRLTEDSKTLVTEKLIITG
ncbi:MAG: T9SS type A sorting domain-containing protein [Bacteroidetes bacterium]|nr:T9SS type A sorting domain-containing protein [Bacteroidota bacterium]